jgi:hypothetical protein
VSHITSGYINNSPSKRLVRVNEAFEGVGGADGVLNGTSASSVFNYANVTKEGLVDNTLITYGRKRETVCAARGQSDFYEGK